VSSRRLLMRVDARHALAHLIAVVASAIFVSSTATPAFAQVSHNAPSKYGATFYYFNQYESLPESVVYTPTLTWHRHDQSWWNTIVQRARNANIGWFAVNAWGQDMINGEDPAGVDPQDGIPWMTKLTTAINSADTTTLKLALFDDTTSEVMRKNRDKGRGASNGGALPGDSVCGSDPACRFDLSDSNGTGEGGWFYFYDQQWKRWFNSVPDQYRFKINNRPVVIMWLGGYEWYSSQSSFSNLIDALKAATFNDFGFQPYVIVETSWTQLDGDANVDAAYRWFNPDSNTSATKTAFNGVTVGHVIPGYDAHILNPSRPIIDRADGNLYNSNLDYVSDSNFVLIESINNVDENCHIIDTTDWGSRELTTTLWYTTNRP